MKNEMIIQIYHSIQIWKKMLIKAAIRVDSAIKQSFIASAPLALRLPEFKIFHSFLKYFHKKYFTKIATVTIIIVMMV
jgi:hypothetical protein